MPTPSPLLPDTGPVTVALVAGGQPLDGRLYRVRALTVTKGINCISEARIELVDGDPATGDFTATDSDCLKPGQPMEVHAGYDARHSPLFTGIVVSLGLAARGGQGAVLTVLCMDEAVKMNGNRVTKAFAPQTTGEALQAVVGQYGGIRAAIAPTSGVQHNLVQHNATDWDFVVAQAEANGQVVISDLGRLATVALATASSASVAVEHGTNVYDFALRIDARTQFAAVTAQAWAAGQPLQATARPPGLALPGNLTSAELAAAVGQQVYALRTAAEASPPALQALADAHRAKRTLALLHGTVDTAGTSAAAPGAMASLAGFANRFNGPAYIAGVRHTIADGSWKTQLRLGTDGPGVAERGANVAEPGGATGLQGLCCAVVKALQPDPEGGFRVQVAVAGLAGAAPWARLAQPYASAGAGLCFYPEIGDEVVLGFLGEDVRGPVILGALQGKERAPACPPDEKNTKKAVVTRSKLTLEFDDEKKVITLTTPGHNQLVISDEAQGLTLTDQQQNSITLSDQGLALVSTSGLSIRAAQDIQISTTGGTVTIQAGHQVELKGLNVRVAADAELSLSGSATAALQGGAATTITGAMVMIN